MRLYHWELIKYLPKNQLLNQHKECCGLRGKGWGKNQSTVNYVFKYNPAELADYHVLVIWECMNRKYKINKRWINYDFRGLQNRSWTDEELTRSERLGGKYPEHTTEYLAECINLLKSRGVDVAEILPTSMFIRCFFNNVLNKFRRRR